MSAQSFRILATGGAGIEALRTEPYAIPAPRAGEVLIRMRAASLNYRDLIGLRGQLPGMTKDEYVPLSCGCGEVLATGDGVTRVRPGDRVSPIFAQGWISGGMDLMPRDTHLGGTVDGVARSHAIFAEDSLVVIPDAIGDLEAATLPCAALTAWHALFGPRRIAPGEMVVVQGTGGVSIAALQFAKAAGAVVAVTSSSDVKLGRAQALGADYLVNYRTEPSWAAAVRRLAGRGADIVVDVVGASGIEQSAAVLDTGGIVAAVGMLEGSFSWGLEPGMPVIPVAVGNRGQFEQMLRGITANHVRPVVDRVFPAAQLPDALRALEVGSFFGKIAVQFD